MPIFEFHCRKCSVDFEQLVLGGEQAVSCPQCGSGSVEKLFSTFGFQSGGRTSAGSGKASCNTCKTHNCSSCR